MGVGGVAVRLLYVGFHGRKVQNQLSRKIALYGSKTDGGRSIPASIVRRLSRSLVTLLSLTQRETYPQRWDRFESTLHYCGPWSLHFPASAQPAKPLVPLRGLTAQECFFPVMAVREGLVKTAIKTTETGCIQRRRWRMSWSATTALSGIFWAISSSSYNYPVDVTDKKSGFMSGMLQVGLDDSPLELQAKLDEEYAQSTPDTHFHLQSQSRLRSSCEPLEDSQKHKQTWEAGGATIAKPNGIYERIPNRWEVGLAVAVLDGQFQHVSFANSISTTKGRAPTCCGQNLEEHSPTFGRAIIFINALIENPSFDSQTKDTLSLQASKFGTKPLLSEDLMKKVSKSPIIKKTDGTKRSRPVFHLAVHHQQRIQAMYLAATGRDWNSIAHKQQCRMLSFLKRQAVSRYNRHSHGCGSPYQRHTCESIPGECMENAWHHLTHPPHTATFYTVPDASYQRYLNDEDDEEDNIPSLLERDVRSKL
ncbi:hypothetical protein DFH06DRAFT_1325353 [Mycena polygramma]|nr:hypothetical protein DFH06DRAFT_1325353 [Mycena polygramma]